MQFKQNQHNICILIQQCLLQRLTAFIFSTAVATWHYAQLETQLLTMPNEQHGSTTGGSLGMQHIIACIPNMKICGAKEDLQEGMSHAEK